MPAEPIQRWLLGYPLLLILANVFLVSLGPFALAGVPLLTIGSAIPVGRCFLTLWILLCVAFPAWDACAGHDVGRFGGGLTAVEGFGVFAPAFEFAGVALGEDVAEGFDGFG